MTMSYHLVPEGGITLLTGSQMETIDYSLV